MEDEMNDRGTVPKWNGAAIALVDHETPTDPRSPRSRLEALLDRGSCATFTAEDDSGMLAASGTVHGSAVIAFSSNATVQGGAMGVAGCAVLVAAYERALVEDIPVIGLWHSGGARLREGVESLHAVGQVFAVMTRASGRIPQLSVVLGPAAGGAAYGPALTDIVICAPDGRVFVTGPDVVRSVTGQDVDALELGGPETHGRNSGVVHVVAESEDEAYLQTRRIADLLANLHGIGSVADANLDAVLPQSPKRAYDVHPLVTGVLDVGSDVELHPRWAPNIVTTLGRLGGRTVGVIANNPLRLAGCLDALSAEKAARFVRMCDAFGVPLVVIVDVPGYLPGINQEWGGIVRRGAKLLHAFAEASVPRVTLITRKAYGGAYVAMNSRALGATRVFAWRSAEIAVMGPVAAIRILHRRQLAAVTSEEDRARLESQLAADHAATVGGLDRALALGLVDKVIEPSATRSALIRALTDAAASRGRHGNIPL
jgi:acetyl-CoA/propionyl-CoA carboxylase carboxyl transferase subunit